MLTEPVLTEPVLVEPVLIEPALIEPVLVEPVLVEPVLIEPGCELAAPEARPAVVRIVLVEDDPVMQLGLEQFFEDYPQFEIVGQAADGYAGLEAVQNLKPDLVLMDVGLPQLDGITAARRIRAEMPQVRIVILTSHTSDHEMLAALSSGADAYCVKGTSLEQLEVAITSAQEGALYLDPQIARRVLSHLKPQPIHTKSLLSERELEVLKLMVDGKSNPEIAALLYLSLSTVKCHVRSVMDKLSVDDRVQAAVVALRSGLI